MASAILCMSGSISLKLTHEEGAEDNQQTREIVMGTGKLLMR